MGILGPFRQSPSASSKFSPNTTACVIWPYNVFHCFRLSTSADSVLQGEKALEKPFGYLSPCFHRKRNISTSRKPSNPLGIKVCFNQYFSPLISKFVIDFSKFTFGFDYLVIDSANTNVIIIWVFVILTCLYIKHLIWGPRK